MRLLRCLCGLLLPLLLPAKLSAQAQPPATAFEGTVVDQLTGEPLPFASIYINKVSATIANAEGGFVVKADSADVARISYLGYAPRHIVCGQMPPVVRLTPVERTLSEVVVLPYPLKKFIPRLTKETLRQMQKFRRRQSTFFYRQTAFADSTCYELVEAFLTGHPAVALHDLRLALGRYASIRPDSTTQHYTLYGNFFTFSQIDIASRESWPGWTDDIVPLFRHWDVFYDVDYDLMPDDEGRIIALHFTPKPEVKRPVIEATLYVDEASLHVRRIEGTGHHVFVRNTRDVLGRDSVVRRYRQVYETAFDFVVNMTDERGFTEVQSVFVDEHHLAGTHKLTTRSTLFNLGRAPEGDVKEQLQFNSHLHRRIDHQQHDSLFWRENEIVRRTPVEHRVNQLFEEKQLFGVW